MKMSRSAVSPRITADYLFLDVKVGRAALRKLVGDRHDGPFVIPVSIDGVILDGMSSGDDGVSQEFTVRVKAIRLGTPQPRETTSEVRKTARGKAGVSSAGGTT